MAMSVEITAVDGTCIMVRASGDYAPDVMYDLQNRAAALLSHAASVGLQVTRALAHDFETAPEVNDEPVAEDEAA